MQNEKYSNTADSSATPFKKNENVSRDRSFHQCAAMHAARMIGFQYTRETKAELKRDCLGHLRASLSGAIAHE